MRNDLNLQFRPMDNPVQGYQFLDLNDPELTAEDRDLLLGVLNSHGLELPWPKESDDIVAGDNGDSVSSSDGQLDWAASPTNQHIAYAVAPLPHPPPHPAFLPPPFYSSGPPPCHWLPAVPTGEPINGGPHMDLSSELSGDEQSISPTEAPVEHVGQLSPQQSSVQLSQEVVPVTGPNHPSHNEANIMRGPPPAHAFHPSGPPPSQQPDHGSMYSNVYVNQVTANVNVAYPQIMHTAYTHPQVAGYPIPPMDVAQQQHQHQQQHSPREQQSRMRSHKGKNKNRDNNIGHNHGQDMMSHAPPMQLMDGYPQGQFYPYPAQPYYNPMNHAAPPSLYPYYSYYHHPQHIEYPHMPHTLPMKTDMSVTGTHHNPHMPVPKMVSQPSVPVVPAPKQEKRSGPSYGQNVPATSNLPTCHHAEKPPQNDNAKAQTVQRTNDKSAMSGPPSGAVAVRRPAEQKKTIVPLKVEPPSSQVPEEKATTKSVATTPVASVAPLQSVPPSTGVMQVSPTSARQPSSASKSNSQGPVQTSPQSGGKTPTQSAAPVPQASTQPSVQGPPKVQAPVQAQPSPSGLTATPTQTQASSPTHIQQSKGQTAASGQTTLRSAAQPSVQPQVQAPAQPSSQTTARPPAQPSTQPATSAAQPTAQPQSIATSPAQSATQSTASNSTQPAAQLVAPSRTQATLQPVSPIPVAQSVAPSPAQPSAQSAPQPSAQPAAQSVAQATALPLAQPAPVSTQPNKQGQATTPALAPSPATPTAPGLGKAQDGPAAVPPPSTPPVWPKKKAWSSLFNKDPTPQQSNMTTLSYSSNSANTPNTTSASSATTTNKPLAQVRPFNEKSAPLDGPQPVVPTTPNPWGQSQSSKDNSAPAPALPLPNLIDDPKLFRLGEFLHKYKLEHRAVSLQPRGLTNRSNWCYINATLQALIACPPFYNLMRALPHTPSNSRDSRTPIIDCMKTFVNEFTPLSAITRMKRSERAARNREEGVATNDIQVGSAFEPNYVYRMLSTIRSDTLVEGRQEDAEEFLSVLLNGLNDEMLELVKLVADPSEFVNGEPNANGDAEIHEEEEADDGEWQVMGPNNKGAITRKQDFGHTPISDIFRGQLRSRVIRVHASETTDNVQPFFTLQLDIESAVSVKKALEQYVARDTVEGLTCARSNTEVQAFQELQLEDLPPVLLLHLKWFDYRLDGCSKICKKVEYEIDLKVDTKLLSNKKPASQQHYKLVAVVYHDGNEATKGHYVTDAFHVGYGCWIRYDDSVVRVVHQSQVLSPKPPRVPYLLYYRRQDTIVGH